MKALAHNTFARELPGTRPAAQKAASRRVAEPVSSGDRAAALRLARHETLVNTEPLVPRVEELRRAFRGGEPLSSVDPCAARAVHHPSS